MPLETINCTKCGSHDVRELKAGTYACASCESIFKYVDLSKVTVQREFCECGKPVEGQCVRCQRNLCRSHWSIPSPPPNYESWVWIPTALPAYRPHDRPTDRHWIPVSMTPPPADQAVAQVGLFYGKVYCSDCIRPLLTQASELVPKALASHIEKLGDEGAGDERAELKISGKLCADALCEEPARSECGCCRMRWCDRHSGPDTKLDSEDDTPWRFRYWLGSTSGINMNVNSAAYSDWVTQWYEATRPCRGCCREFGGRYASVFNEMGLTDAMARQLVSWATALRNNRRAFVDRHERRRAQSMVELLDKVEAEIKRRALDPCSMSEVASGFFGWAPTR
jgi:hypothetical protein